MSPPLPPISALTVSPHAVTLKANDLIPRPSHVREQLQTFAGRKTLGV
jgi:hypothetical protein